MRSKEDFHIKKLLRRHLLWLCLTLPMVASKFLFEFSFPGGLELLPIFATLASVYLLLIDLPYLFGRVVVSHFGETSLAPSVIYIVWTVMPPLLGNCSSPEKVILSLFHIPEYINNNGLALAVVFSVAVMLYVVTKTNHYPPVNCFPFIPFASIILMSYLPIGVMGENHYLYSTSSYFLVVALISISAHMGFVSRRMRKI
jgi:hypothetical protein